jgi:hypothetical protein
LTDDDEPQRPTDRVREFQLREYEIADGHLDEFVDAWRRGVKPLRERFGFTVEAWLVRAESRFVWLLGYGGPGSFATADEAYYASPERAALDPDPAVWIVEQRTAAAEAVVSGEP